MSQEQLEQEEEETYEINFQPLTETLKKIYTKSEKKGLKNILDLERGIINFDVNYKSLHENDLQIQFANNINTDQQLYNNHHYGPIKDHSIYNEIQIPTKDQLDLNLQQNLIKNITQLQLKNEILRKKDKCQQLQNSIKKQIKGFYNNNNLSSKQGNIFSTSYEYNILQGSFKKTNFDTISPDFKEFTFETSTKGQFYNKTQLYKRQKHEEIKDFQDLETEFLDLSKEIKDNFEEKKQEKQAENEKEEEKLQEYTDKKLALVKTLSLNSNQWVLSKIKAKKRELNESFDSLPELNEDEEDQEQQQQQETTEQNIENQLKKANIEQKYTELWNQICGKKQKNQENQPENNNENPQENERMTGQQFLQYLNTIKLGDEDSETADKSSNALQNQEQNVQSKFKIIRLTNITGGTVGTRAANYDQRWASEDESDLSTFYDQLPLDKFAVDYHFELDDFQKRAVLKMENRESILVCAHTSAGKTVVAEYAIALSKKHKRRCIYTSPIKALSNEKYRKLSKRFDGDIGIITGDITLNPQASCLIVTTEILRNMLYKGNDMIRDIEWVIFDEVHYINNPERGVVWEETIIMLPDHINIVMLSATIPNYMDFANWVGRTKRRKIHVQKTLWRPVPLEHSVYVLNKFHVVKDRDGPFLKEDYAYLKETIDYHSEDFLQQMARKQQEMLEKKEKGTYKDKKRNIEMKNAQKIASNKFISKISRGDVDNAKNKDEVRNMYELITHCNKEDLLPMVIFIFSKNKINQIAQGLSFMNLVTKLEESRIIRYFDHAVKKLKPSDQILPQLIFLRTLLKKGIAVHHGDLIPIAKEIVEILFSEGLIKVLLATETFAMGLNMPTKTVVFYSLKKHDGKEIRFLNSSEYTQMAGRAGRRGLDEKGTVILYFSNPEQLPEKNDLEKIIAHKGEQIKSKFKVTYQVILNKLNSKELNVIDMMRSSFSENDKFSQIPKNLKKIQELKAEFLKMTDFQCKFQPKSLSLQAPIEDYYNIAENLKDYNDEYFELNGPYIKKLQFPKYALIIGGENNGLDLGILMSHEGRQKYPFTIMLVSPIMEQKKKIVLEFESDKTLEKPKKVRDENYVFRIMQVSNREIMEIFDDKITNSKQKIDLSNTNNLHDIAQHLIQKKDTLSEQQILSKNQKTKDFKKLNFNLQDTQELRELKDLTQSDFIESKCYDCELLPQHLNQIQKREEIQEQLEKLIKDVDENTLHLKDNFEGRVEVLRKLRYIDEDNQPLIKASIARELGDSEVYMCELIVENVLGELQPAEIACLLSGFVCQYNNRKKQFEREHLLDELYIKDDMTDIPYFSEETMTAAQQIYTITENIVKDEMMEGVVYVGEGDIHNHIKENVLNFSLAKVIYEWCSGVDFIDIMQSTDAQEGIIIRTIMRLENLLKNFKSSAKIIGHIPLSHKIDSCMEVIKRDIVFTQSLYYDEDSQFQ